MSADIVKSLSVSLELLRNAIACTEHICICGPSSTGKTTLVRKVFEEQDDYLHAYIPCELFSSSSKLFIKIYESFVINSGIGKNRNTVPSQVWALGDFIETLEKFQSRAISHGFKRLFIVLDRIDSLKGTTALESISSLATFRDLSLIFITTNTIESVASLIKSDDVKINLDINCTSIYVAYWSQQDIIDTILLRPPAHKKKIFKKFVNNVVRILYSSRTKDYIELRDFCRHEFAYFLTYYSARSHESIRKSEKLDENAVITKELYKGFDLSPLLPSILSSFLASLKSDKFSGEENWRLANERDRKPEVITGLLIIACYIAATTSPSDDKKNFVKAQKRKVSRQKSESVNYVALKQFTLERLIHIHKGLLHIHYGESLDSPSKEDFLDQYLDSVTNLEEVDIIQLTMGDGLDPMSRYKLSGHITREYVNRLASYIEFEIQHINGLD